MRVFMHSDNVPHVIKHRLQAAVGSFHRAAMRRPLPDKLALYLHSLSRCAADVHECMRRFSDLGYRFVGPDEFLSRSGRMIMLTFDDNYQSWFKCLPMFERLGAKVTFYVNTFPLRGTASDAELAWFFQRISASPEPTLSVDELRCIADAGHTIGAHTHTHPNLAAVPLDQAKDEIRTSKQVLEDILGKPVSDFAYPFGTRRHFSTPLLHYCFEIGFKTVATGLPAMQHAKPENGIIHRSALLPELPFKRNLDNLRVDGRVFERITGRNAVAR
jgi:hypothetical protein